jgi:hypothetical protein
VVGLDRERGFGHHRGADVPRPYGDHEQSEDDGYRKGNPDREEARPKLRGREHREFLAFTNHDASTFVSPDDRRTLVLKSHVLPRAEDYHQQLFAWSDGNMGIIYRVLLDRDLNAFNSKGHAHMTDAKGELIEDSRPALDGNIIKLMDEGRHPCFTDTPAEMMRLWAKIGGHSQPIRPNPSKRPDWWRQGEGRYLSKRRIRTGIAHQAAIIDLPMKLVERTGNTFAQRAYEATAGSLRAPGQEPRGSFSRQ